MSIAIRIVTALTDAVIEGKVSVKDVETTAVALANAYVSAQAALSAKPASVVVPTTLTSDRLNSVQSEAKVALGSAATASASTVSASGNADSHSASTTTTSTTAPVTDNGAAPVGGVAVDSASNAGALVIENSTDQAATVTAAPAAVAQPVTLTDPAQVAIAAVNAAITPAAAQAPAVVTQ